MKRSLRLGLALVLVLVAGCGGAPAARPKDGPKGTSQDRERAACEDGEELHGAISRVDGEGLRRPRIAGGPLASPALLAAPPPTFEMQPLPDAPTEPLTLDQLGPITKINIVGNRSLTSARIRAMLSLREGDRPTTEALRRDVKALYAAGLFDDISVTFDGGPDHAELAFMVQERPARGEIFFTGAESQTPAALREIAALGDHPSRAAVSEAASRIKNHYAEQGRSYAEVSPRLRTHKDQVDICFRITEGVVVRIARWAFEGNQAVSAAELRAVMDTEKGRVNTEGGVYREERIADEQTRQLTLYYDRGYLMAGIDPPVVTTSEDRARLSVTVAVHEGQVFRIGALNFTGDLAADPTRYAALLQTKQGDVINRSRVIADLDRIRAFHSETGQPFIEVALDTQLDVQHGVVLLTFQMTRRKVIQ